MVVVVGVQLKTVRMNIIQGFSNMLYGGVCTISNMLGTALQCIRM